MSKQETVTASTTNELDEKNISPVAHHDFEADEEKAIPGTSISYAHQGTQTERDLIFKQDLRIIPLSAGIYLLCYLDRSNIGNAKVYQPQPHQCRNSHLN